MGFVSAHSNHWTGFLDEALRSQLSPSMSGIGRPPNKALQRTHLRAPLTAGVRQQHEPRTPNCVRG